MTREEMMLHNIQTNTVGLDDTFKFHCDQCGKCCTFRDDIILSPMDIFKMAKELEIGEFTVRDIVEEIKKPGRDPREDAPEVVFRRDVRDFDDLEPGMEMTGTVRNVVDFGAFVDIGVKNDGLVHVSQMSDRFIKHPMDVVSVGDTVKVKILEVDKERQKISLTMKLK